MPQPNGCPIVGARGLMICMLAHSVNHEDQKETALANAEVIASAPKCLKALEAIYERANNASFDFSEEIAHEAKVALIAAGYTFD